MNATFTLPEDEEMLARLIGVANTPHLSRDLYTRLLEAAGRTLTMDELVRLLHTAFSEYTATYTLARPAMVLLLPQFVEVLVQDRALAQTILDHPELSDVAHPFVEPAPI